jgi:hypothetical protein
MVSCAHGADDRDAVAVPLDYEVQQLPPHAEPATPPLARAPMRIRGTPALAIEARPATMAALAAWRDYLLARDPGNRQIAAWVARLAGQLHRAARRGLRRPRALICSRREPAPPGVYIFSEPSTPPSIGLPVTAAIAIFASETILPCLVSQ